jgi:hypothetical protein
MGARPRHPVKKGRMAISIISDRQATVQKHSKRMRLRLIPKPHKQVQQSFP